MTFAFTEFLSLQLTPPPAVNDRQTLVAILEAIVFPSNPQTHRLDWVPLVLVNRGILKMNLKRSPGSVSA